MSRLLFGALVTSLLGLPCLAQTWTPAAGFSAAERADMAGVFFAGRVLAVGGSPLIAPKLEVAPVDELTPGGASWAALTPLDGPTWRCGAGEDALGRLIVFGGVDGLDPTGDKGKAYWYDLVDGKKGGVSQRTSSAPDDHFAYATDASHRVYSIGGGPGASATGGNPNSAHVERYDAASNLWTAVAPMNQPVADAAGVWDGAGHLLVIGGYGQAGALSANVARFDVASGTWSDSAIPDLPVATADHAAARGSDGRIYVVGGRTAAGLSADVWVLDASFSSWSAGPALPSARADAAATLASDDQLYLLGGRDGSGGTGAVLTLFTPTCPSFPGATTHTEQTWRGMTVELSQTVEGGAPLSYRWRKDGVELFDGPSAGGGQLSGTATDSLLITGAAELDNGSYELAASNGCGLSLAPAVVLDVATPPELTGVWSFEVLTSPGALGTAANGLGDDQVVGSATFSDPTYGSLGHPTIWPLAPGPALDLTPPSSVGGSLSAVEAGVQVGWYWWPYTVPQQGTGYHMHACVWSGSSQSYIDVQPSGWEFGSLSDTDGTHHVGTLRYDESSTTADGHYWLSSQKSAIKLTPPGDWGSSAVALQDGHQFGSVIHPFAVVHAAKWSGSAGSFVNMNPTGSSWSYIVGAGPGAEVGRATFAGQNHAGLWGQSAATFVDLNPSGATGSDAVATAGGLQLGSASFTGSSSYALLWSGAPDDYIDLSVYTDASHPNPVARDVEVLPSGEVLVVGSAYNPTTSQTDGILWVMSPKSLVADVSALSLSAGGTQSLELAAGAQHAGFLYLVLGSTSGTSPGLAVDGVTLPLNLDNYLLLSASSAGSGSFQGTLGFLDASGRASAQLVLPAASDPALAGLALDHAALVVDLAGSGTAVFASNPEGLDLLP